MVSHPLWLWLLVAAQPWLVGSFVHAFIRSHKLAFERQAEVCQQREIFLLLSLRVPSSPLDLLFLPVSWEFS